MRKIFLTRAEEFRVAGFLHEIEERLLRERPAAQEVAKLVAERIGREVSPGSVARIALDAGINWRPKNPRGRTSPTATRLNGRIGDLEARVQDLEAGVTKLMLTLNELCQQLGYKSKHEINGR